MSSNKFIDKGLTYDDVLLVPSYSDVLPREVSINSKFSKNIDLNIPISSAAMDTVTESSMAIAIAREGGIGVLHKNMSIEEQAEQVRTVKRSESGMIMDPVTLNYKALVIDAKEKMRNYKGKDCIYVHNITRNDKICFIDKVQYFGGGLLCMIPKNNIDMEDLKKFVNIINGTEFKKNYMYSNRFKIGHKQLSNALVSNCI